MRPRLNTRSLPTVLRTTRNGNARGYRGRDQRLRPLRRKVRRMREDVADQRNDCGDGCLAADAVGRAVHLQQEHDCDQPANGAANRGEEYMVDAEGCENVAARHDQKAGEPRAGKLLGGGTRSPPERKSSSARLPTFKVAIAVSPVCHGYCTSPLCDTRPANANHFPVAPASILSDVQLIRRSSLGDSRR